MSKVRVRIAPSPTGSPHVGTAYVALFNYCFAKSQGGEFLLRIEDTDQSRSEERFETAILDALRWVGLSWDEGPDVGGPKGPYRQSERTDIYGEHAQKLMDGGHAYPCFCTPARLDALRAQQKAEGGNLGYDGKCLGLDAATISAKKAAGELFTVRMRVPNTGTCDVHDRLRGPISFDYGTIDHQVLVKSDGFPTYHLANVVDDHLMGITHVIRGEEWLSSLPKHILLYEYFGWEAPEVIHLPLLRNEDSSKLSKRKNPTSILYYQDIGILPEALLNFLGLMAYSMPDEREIFALADMVARFDIDRISLGGPIFDQQKLQWVNQKHIATLGEDALCQRLIDWRLNPGFIRKLMPFMTDRVHRLGDFMELCDFMFYSDVSYPIEQVTPKKREAEETRDVMQMLVWELEQLSAWQHDQIEAAIKGTAELVAWSVRDMAHAARVAICGKVVAPPLFQVMEILGSDVSRARLMKAINTIGPLGKKKLAKLEKRYRQACSQRPSEA